MKYKTRVAVIGGGAAGLTAAAACARKLGKGSVVILEKQARIGRKLLATGNGRCNISNKNMNSLHYYGDKAIIENVLKDFGFPKLKRFFSSIGLLLREDSDGRIYPYSNQASTVLDCIKNELARLGVQEICEFNISCIKHNSNGFLISSGLDTVEAHNIIFACGSNASPALGADDSGLKLLKTLNINSSPFFPSLSPIETAEKYKMLKGVRAKGNVEVIADGDTITDHAGEIQFTDKGLSGICVFECSRPVNEFLLYGTVFGKKAKKLIISLDLLHELSDVELCRYLRSCRKLFSDQPAGSVLSGTLNRKLSEAIVRSVHLDNMLCGNINENDLIRISSAAKQFEFSPVRSDAFKNAQVCAGGIGSDEIDVNTLMSKKYENLFFCGEMLNVDGECGGYNLHFAFGSALKAAKNIK